MAISCGTSNPSACAASIAGTKIETAILLPDGRVFARSIGFHGQHDVFDDEVAWMKAVEASWRRESAKPALVTS